MPAEPTNVASGVDPALYPVAVLIDELGHDDRQARLRSIKSLGTIATALGPERTREELLPFLQEVLDDEDELQVALAEELGKGVPWVGGCEYAHALTAPLEELCNMEEISVREKAVESLKHLINEMRLEQDPQVARHLCSLISRLASHNWFTSRISACGLFAAAIARVSESKQDDLVKTYLRLCGDETPMVRRQAANVLGEVAAAVPQESMLSEVVEVFEKLSRDEQESVRILAISNCVALGRLKSTAEWQGQILPVVKACAQDKSWRVRYVMAENVQQLCEVFHAKATAHIVPLYLRLLQDQEEEVRTIAAARVGAVSKVKPDKEFLVTFIPAMEKLTAPRERSQHVRASLAGSVLSLTPIFGSKLTVDYLVDIFLQLIRDESPEVRLKLLGTLGELSSTMDLEVLSQSLLPSIKDLGKDRQWRVRLTVIDCMPSLAKYLGEAQFTEELSSLFVVWLEDPVFCVRDAIAASFRRLYEVLGMSWCETHVVPRMQALLANGNYLYRIAAVLCAGKLAEVAAAPFLERHLVPLVVKMAADPVPNVRFNAAKTIQAMQPFAARSSPKVAEGSLLPCLRGQLDDEDPDVKFFARRALTEMGISA